MCVCAYSRAFESKVSEEKVKGGGGVGEYLIKPTRFARFPRISFLLLLLFLLSKKNLCVKTSGRRLTDKSSIVSLGKGRFVKIIKVTNVTFFTPTTSRHHRARKEIFRGG